MSKSTILLSLALLAASTSLHAQGVTQTGIPTNQPAFPLESYQELPDPKPQDAAPWMSVTQPRVSWASTDYRYAKHEVPGSGLTSKVVLSGWKNEKVHAQAVIFTPSDLEDVTLSLSAFTMKNEVLPSDALEASFMRYVMTDQLNLDGRGGCSERPDHSKYDSSLVADAVDHMLGRMRIERRSTQPVWVSCRIPKDAASGTYQGCLIVSSKGQELSRLPLQIKVGSRTLPDPSAWKFHLDLWQNPFSVSRYYQVPVWSQEHLDAMRPIMKRLADSGQKVITASIMHMPWNGQTEDYFESMVTWVRHLDGSWTFDFAVFARWVEMMMGVGITEQINCYSMVPWRLSFQYFDQAPNSMQEIKCEPGSKEYDEMWTAMLSSFASHLKAKGWFAKTCIAMDERPADVMQKTLAVIRRADMDFKVSLAGNWSPDLTDGLYDYCITSSQDFPGEVLLERKKEGKISTFYTCCAEAYPNTFTFSAPAEAAFLGLFAAKKHLDGYLRWAYNSWPTEPLLDSRFRTWAAGDTYIVYPGNRTSIRFERLLEGIQDYEKIRILRDEFQSRPARLKALEKALGTLELQAIPETPASVLVGGVKKALNAF